MIEQRNKAGYTGKRLVDFILLALTAPLTIPMAAICAVAVLVGSGRPILYRQTRVGLHGYDFELLKFRTMKTGPNPIIPDPDRITRVGRLLRRTSLDELPQLVNVLRGEMSIVGPRPTLRYQVDRYDQFQRRRLEVRPGLTGLAQVSGRNSLRWADRMELDVRYVDQQSIRLDAMVLMRTATAMIGREGVLGHDPTDPFVVQDAPEGEQNAGLLAETEAGLLAETEAGESSS